MTKASVLVDTFDHRVHQDEIRACGMQSDRREACWRVRGVDTWSATAGTILVCVLGVQVLLF